MRNEEIIVNCALSAVENVMGVPVEEFSQRLRKNKYVILRAMFINICERNGLRIPDFIERINVLRYSVYHSRKVHEGYYTTDKNYKLNFDRVLVEFEKNYLWELSQFAG
jgi:hypothetical protein